MGADGSGPIRLAHRGDSRHATENTTAALLAALAAPACDGLEFDVRFARDGVPVLHHDLTLTRVLGYPERVDQLTAAQLAALGVSTLANVLGAVPSETFLDIEVKEFPREEFFEVVAAARGGELRNAVVSSFQDHAVAAVRAAHPSWRCWLNSHDLYPQTVGRAVEAGCEAISVRWTAITRPGLERVRREDLALAAFTAFDTATVDRLARLGVTAVCVEGSALDG